MPISFIITGIFTGTAAAALALSFDIGAVWAFLSYALSGALAVLGAAAITSIRHNFWPRKGWHDRLSRMASQSGGAPQVGLFAGVKRGRQVRM
ncbi:hypothetical protein GCM10016455_09750 [Aliiroseovarius zhejiangensis]|uniref:Uncharacterized protein n=1 Tax=Aliiroseovarius zhejiangensis TaxID=1632025 RepID=A0ABQ3IS25_9RHOB|nr:hypothetical protein [Aliiroseovarius zhejiangensis]GHE91855.1 hypothetical protein GCM10016455_09750 [Aliiroseovarius zhejiangensis]